jgi:hypothetical protein
MLRSPVAAAFEFLGGVKMPLRFKALVYSEVILQLPFFFVGAYAYIGEFGRPAGA